MKSVFQKALEQRAQNEFNIKQAAIAVLLEVHSNLYSKIELTN